MLDKIARESLPLLACPACEAPLECANTLSCTGCRRDYPVQDGLPLLFHPHDPGDNRDVTEIVKSFYEANPFPNYDDFDSRQSLEQKARRGVFARLLDDQIPKGALVLEAGCGTGQLTNFLGMSWKRRIFGSDVCLNSLRLAKDFRDRFSIRNASFLQMNLFRPAFKKESFDLVICNGVLHHTGDPATGFRCLARLIKPGGYIVVGLYNSIGRLTTDLRRFLLNNFGDGLRFLDGHMRDSALNEIRKRAWFMDQYKHPHESKHSYDEVMAWFESAQFDFLLSIPKIGMSPFQPDEKLFAAHDKGTRITRFLTQVAMLAEGGVDGALFIMIGCKRQQSLQRFAFAASASKP